MFRQLCSPMWHVPMPLLTGESRSDAHLWRENVLNRERMGRELAERGIKDVPWSSSRRLIGVVLTCITFGLWVVAGVTSLVVFALGGTVTRTVVIAYYCVAAMYAAPMNLSVYRWAAGLEVGVENGWKLLVKGKVDCSKQPHLFCSHPHGLFCAGVCLNLILSSKGLAAVRATHIRLFGIHSWHPSFQSSRIGCEACFLPCTRDQMRRTLERRGESSAIVPGGEGGGVGRTSRTRKTLPQERVRLL